ncbi:MAG: IPT/TIG domain-containing protein [Candidatus Magnetomorum sp.]|nr:IPT/TIG domain-containing protein [Candidatus Magnetomorum sp.]
MKKTHLRHSLRQLSVNINIRLMFQCILILLINLPLCVQAADFEYIQLYKHMPMNADVVVQQGDVSQSAIDNAGNCYATTDFAKSKGDTDNASGLPNDNTFNVSGRTIQLADYDGNNARQITVPVYDSSKSQWSNYANFQIDLPDGLYEDIWLVVTSGSGHGQFSFNYQYASISEFSGNRMVPDWTTSSLDNYTDHFVLAEKLDFASIDGALRDHDNKYLYYYKFNCPHTDTLLQYLTVYCAPMQNGAKTSFLGGVAKRYHPPEISSLNPDSARSGEKIVIKGDYFINGSHKINRVTIGGSSVDFTIKSATEIEVTAGSKSGEVEVFGITGQDDSGPYFTLDETPPEIIYIYYTINGDRIQDTTDQSYIEKYAVKREQIVGDSKSVEYALVIEPPDASGAGSFDNFGNPDPQVGKHWISENQPASVTIEPVVKDTLQPNIQFFARTYKLSYAAGGSWYSNNYTLSSSGNFSVLMSSPKKVHFNWVQQYAVKISTLPQAMANNISVSVIDNTGQFDHTGSGKWWYDEGTDLKFNADDGCLTVSGYKDYNGDMSQLFTGSTYTIHDLDSSVNIVWEYEAPVYKETVYIGKSLGFNQLNTLPYAVRSHIDVDSGPLEPTSTTAENPEDLYYWSSSEGRLFPLVGNRTIKLEWPLQESSDCSGSLIVEITTRWPIDSDYIYPHVANTPPVPLDPDSQDQFYFHRMIYTDCDATVSPELKFSSGKKGLSTLLFTRSIDGAAVGNTNTEFAHVRVVKTQLWNENKIIQTAPIGTEIESAYHNYNVPHNGYIFWPNARYNASLYIRETMIGPIFPVNTEYMNLKEYSLVIIWYTMKDNISWSWKPVEYKCQWPEVTQQIVIASREGSEGKNSDKVYQDSYDPKRYENLMVYYQNDPSLPGYNPNEEHALIAPSYRFADAATRPQAAFALRNDLNIETQDEKYTSKPFVLVQFYDTQTSKFGMDIYQIKTIDTDNEYTFDYGMKAGDPVVAPYPLNLLIGIAPPSEIAGKNADPLQKCYWEDHKGQSWAISGDTDDDSEIQAYFWYPRDPSFWYNRDDDGNGSVESPGQPIPWLPDGETVSESDKLEEDDLIGKPRAVQVRYNVRWPDKVPIIKAGETLTFTGGEYRADTPTHEGLPGVLGWAAGEIVYDSLNKQMSSDLMKTDYLARLAPVLEKVCVDLSILQEEFQPANGRVDVVNGFYYFKDLHAGIKNRLYYDPIVKQLCFKGYVNDKTLGDDTLTAAPPSVYVLQPNIMSTQEKDDITSLENIDTTFSQAVKSLFTKSRNNLITETGYTIGLENCSDKVCQQKVLGPGLALMPNGALLDPDNATFKSFQEGYVTLAENNRNELGALPVALHIIKVKKQLYRGAIKTIESGNVFDEKITLRHTADFGANPEDIVFEWYYREEDGSEEAPPSPPGTMGKWQLFPDNSGGDTPGLGMNEICMSGAGAALLVDNLFFCRYRHKNSTELFSDWAGAANSRPPKTGENPKDTWQAQLAEGWVKRVVNGINPFEARVQSFSNSDNPATYVSMIEQAGQRFEGNVAFNPQKDVIENVGLIELYQTVLNRATSLSIELDQPATSSGIVTALLLAASRINGFYNLLGNEAYTDALDPTIGFGSESVEYGSLAPTIFSFMNQVPDLLEEELCLLRGREEEGARPVYNRLLWNFTKAEGEAAYALSYNIGDVNDDGFIDEADGRTMYPQGHGDAWGHYLTALKGYYDLLTHDYFNWESRSEKFSIEGVVIDVDYFDERKFAESAAAKAKVGKEVLNLTYRSRYVEDPDGQWQGYKDTENDRNWGLTGWGRRAYLGAYLDWTAANFILPANDTEHKGIKKVDRTTVPDLMDITAQARDIQQEMNHADTGLNPLGLASDVVPFDIDPSRLQPGSSNAAGHFEQVYERAIKALENAQVIFDHANDLKNRIRQVANDTQEFTNQVEEQDRDYRNRLIELFGTPYEGTIGSGKVYPAGYQGPDYFLYMYVDVNEVSDETIPPPVECNEASDNSGCIHAYFKSMAVTDYTFDENDIDYSDTKVNFSNFFKTDLSSDAVLLSENVSSTDFNILDIGFPMGAGDYTFQAPEKWGLRRSPGQIQIAAIEMVKAEADLQLAMADYCGLLQEIELATEDLQARSDLNSEELMIGDESYAKTKSYNDKIMALHGAAAGMRLVGDTAFGVASAVVAGLPTIIGMSSDPSSTARLAALNVSFGVKTAMDWGATAIDSMAELSESNKELAEMDTDTKIQKAGYKYDIQQGIHEIEASMGNEAPMRLEIFKRKEHMRQETEKFKALLAKGLRLLEERKAYNAKIAAKTQGKRYMDMAFRLNMNDALSKYKSAFDLAARYTYLSAKAYDYETNLSDRDAASAKYYLTEIVKERTLGQLKNGVYVIGRGGLGDIISRINVNYDAMKGQMGFNNPQTETGRFSLRKELFRIRTDEDISYTTGEDDDRANTATYARIQNDDEWHNLLKKYVKTNLWAMAEFRKYCRPFISEDAGAQPGLVIPFETTVLSGKNFFGWPLGGGDHAYDPTNFATKVRSVGLWFEGYDNASLSETPRAYLIPVGIDYMMVPDSLDLDTREWTIVDQKLPVPMPVGNSNLNNPDWIPSLDSLDGSMMQVRRYSSFRAYHDSGYFDENEVSFDSRLVGRSVWNSRWLLIIPAATFHYDKDAGLQTFISTVTDIKLFFQTYAISGG